jgi:ADP-ribosylation factor 1/2
MSIINELIAKLFPASEFRALMVGIDAAGKTSILYKLKLGEVITTIPTIGFNVETLDLWGIKLTTWDVGGCDKIRPLWRHYFANTQLVIFVIDSNDRDRLVPKGESRHDDYNTVRSMMSAFFKEKELEDSLFLIYCNKQDLPNAMTKEQLIETLNLAEWMSEDSEHYLPMYVQPCCATSGDGLYEGLEWAVNELKNPSRRRGRKAVATAAVSTIEEGDKGSGEGKGVVNTPPKSKQELLMEEWLSREDEPDDEFLEKLRNYTLDSWDHRTHLRIAWILLTRHGRKEAMPLIFQLIKNFIENSSRTKRANADVRGTTFHETMTYFWVTMVHYGIIGSRVPYEEFKTFLLMNPQLSNGGLFLNYYSKQLMLMDPISRTQVVAPDLLPLPSMIRDPTRSKALLDEVDLVHLAEMMPAISAMSDVSFLEWGLQSRLPSWGHEVKMRLIYVMLCFYGRAKGGVDKILDCMMKIEKEGYHITINYFWIQMLTYHMTRIALEEKSFWSPSVFGQLSLAVISPTIAVAGSVSAATTSSGDGGSIFKDCMGFHQFYARSDVEELQDSLLYTAYYSRGALDSVEAAKGLVLPDLRSFPNLPLIRK